MLLFFFFFVVFFLLFFLFFVLFFFFCCFFSKAALMNTHNMFYGEIKMLMPLYLQVPFFSVSYLHKFPVVLF